MQLTYKAAEGIFWLLPLILTHLIGKKRNAAINDFLNAHLTEYRFLFFLTVVLDYAIAYWIRRQAILHNVQTKIKVDAGDYITIRREASEESKKEGEEEVEEVEMTMVQYDTEVIDVHMSKILTSTLAYTAMHLITKSPQAILMHIFNPLKNILFSPIHIEYIRGRSMLRPFSKNIMFEFGGSAEASTAAKEQSEKTEKPKAAPVPAKEDKIKKEE
ncbi:hypothetical protein NEDG_01794 [Nematocida displodere]|uniref:Uncharacterized protein n=1 Tax=Nematocida displodere TaxID=1805483 RepID=A0A177EHW6_9MICR|nr:hypothetical protein NEDG_01794 [Nematocida displodere]